MKFCLTVILALFLGTSVYAQDKSPYVIYDSKGKKVTYKKMMDDLGKRNILMFGEQHNCAIAHWLQVEVTKDLLSKGGLILGAEMMEADNQDELDDYLAGKIDQKGLDSLARLWPTYKNILFMMGDHGSLDLVKAQAIKDATMAYFILRN